MKITFTMSIKQLRLVLASKETSGAFSNGGEKVFYWQKRSPAAGAVIDISDEPNSW
jgi:hypothetical protein